MTTHEHMLMRLHILEKHVLVLTALVRVLDKPSHTQAALSESLLDSENELNALNEAAQRDGILT